MICRKRGCHIPKDSVLVIAEKCVSRILQKCTFLQTSKPQVPLPAQERKPVSGVHRRKPQEITASQETAGNCRRSLGLKKRERWRASTRVTRLSSQTFGKYVPLRKHMPRIQRKSNKSTEMCIKRLEPGLVAYKPCWSTSCLVVCEG